MATAAAPSEAPLQQLMTIELANLAFAAACSPTPSTTVSRTRVLGCYLRHIHDWMWWRRYGEGGSFQFSCAGYLFDEMFHRDKLLDYQFVLLFCELICVFISSMFFHFLETWSGHIWFKLLF